MNDSPDACLARARLALDGVSVGDAFGASFYSRPPSHVKKRTLSPDARWLWTDDAAMGISIVEELAARGDIDETSLAMRFATRYVAEPWRGYGPTAKKILTAIHEGTPWREAAQAPYDGSGSKGNGGAMRAPPLGAYFAHDLARVADAASRSALPTHAHVDGQAGAIAVAVAAAVAARMAAGEHARIGRALIGAAQHHVPPSATRDGIAAALALTPDTSVAAAVAELGNGSRELADDTVPLSLWIAARHLDSFEDAMWACLDAGGDMDTTCAIVGGILAAGGAAVPAEWLARREPLPSLG
jgi:ADP-ribosylglycohydrolase